MPSLCLPTRRLGYMTSCVLLPIILREREKYDASNKLQFVNSIAVVFNKTRVIAHIANVLLDQF